MAALEDKRLSADPVRARIQGAKYAEQFGPS